MLKAVALFLLISSCQADPEYDTVNFDSTVTIGKNVTFPVGSIKEITIKDFFDSYGDADGILRADLNGNYSLVFSGNASWNAFRLESSSFVSGDFFLDGNTVTALDPAIMVEEGMTADAMQAVLGESISFAFTVPFIWTPPFDFPDEVQSVEFADIDVTLNITASYYIPFNKVTLLAGSSFTYPDWLVVDGAGTLFDIESGSNSIIAREDIVIPEEGLCIPVHVSGLRDVSFTDEGYGRFVPGGIRNDVSIRLNAEDYFYMADGIVSGSAAITEVYVDMMIDSQSELVFSSASVVLDEDLLNEHFAGKVYEQDWNIPSFLQDADIDIEFTGLNMTVDIVNGLSSGIGLATSFFTEPQTQWNPSYLFDIASGRSSFHLDEKEIPGLNGILSPIPTAFGINIDHIHLYDDSVVVVPDKDYNLSVSTFVQAPLAFTEGSHVAFADTLRQLGITAPLAEAEIRMTAVNSIPLDIDLSAVAVDWEGLPLDEVSVTISPSTISGGSLQSPARTPLTFNIKMASGDSDMWFDAMRIGLGLRCSSGQAGTPLNERQGLSFEDVKICLPQGITTD